MSKDKRNLGVLLAVCIVLVTWIWLVSVHWKNDGLWSQGDAPRHAANGIFWKDFLLSGSLKPQDYALRYYARYPVIAPASYPPVFYCIEGALFLALGPSPYAAKALVLLFSLMACLYLIAWLRRWVAPDAGWEAALLLLLPGFVCWSTAIMLNVPATALAFAALYHARRWIDSFPTRAAHRQLYLSAAFFILATLTYVPSGIVAVIILAWAVASRRWAMLWNWRTLCVGLAVAVFLIPLFWIISRWSPLHVGLSKDVLRTIRAGSKWMFYLKALPSLVGPLLLFLSALGFIIGIFKRRFRHEFVSLLLFLCAGFVALSVLGEREPRYALLLCIPLVCYCSIAFHAFSEWLCSRMMNWCRVGVTIVLLVALTIYGFQARIAAQTVVPRVEGIHEVVDFLGQVAPKEPVFYDGSYDGVFSFYLLAADPDYHRRVVLGGKLLYSYAIMPMWSYRSYVNSVKDVVQAFETRGGCRWLAIEIREADNANPVAQLLREAVRGPEFELVRSFPVSGPSLERIDVYRFRKPVQSVEEVDLPFPILGDGVRFKTRPIQR